MRKPMLLSCLAVCLAAAGCAGMGGGGNRVPADVVSVLSENHVGGECVLELAGDGSVYAVEAAIPLDAVPAACREAAKRHEPNGRPVGAEKELSGGRVYWEVVVETDGRRIELLMNPDGSLAGREDALRAGEYPAAIVESAQRAVGSGELVVVERVTGPEAPTGESYHVKIRTGDEVQRVSVREDGSVVRVMRKMRAEIRVPR